MSFAEQLAARASRRESVAPPSAGSSSLPPPRPNAPSSASAPPSGPSLFADQLKRRAGHDDGSASAAASTSRSLTDAPAKRILSGPLQNQPSVSSTPPRARAPPSAPSPAASSLSSHSRRDKGKSRMRPVENLEKVKPILVPTCTTPNTPNSEDEEDEYSSVGFSLMDASTVSSVGETSAGEGRGSKVSPGKKKSKRRIRPGESPPRVPREAVPNDDISPITKDEAFPDESPNDAVRQIMASTDSELQLRLQRQRLQERGQRSRKDDTIAQTPPARDEMGGADANVDLGLTSAESDVSDNAAVFGAWAEIESLKRRVREAEEQARREAQRAESASNELRIAREASVSSVRENSASTVQAPGGGGGGFSTSASEAVDRGVIRASAEMAPSSVAVDDARERGREATSSTAVPPDAAVDQWRKRALEAEQRLAAATAASPAPQAPPQTATVSAATRLEESDIIRLKNAEIDVLRSQIHRLERRIQEECDRNEDLMRSSSYHHHPDGTPLVIASEWMSTGSRASGAEGELRQLREEIRLLQYQLQSGPTGSTAGESTLSSLDGHEERRGNTAREEEVDGNEVQEGSSSFWGLCCVRRSRRGYGRV